MEFAQLGIDHVKYSDVDPESTEIYWKDELIFTKVHDDDVQMLKDLLALRIRSNKGRKRGHLRLVK